MRRPLYFLGHGRLARRDGTLVLEHRDGSVLDPDDQPWETGHPHATRPTGQTSRLPLEAIHVVYLLGEVDLNRRVLALLGRAGIPVVVADGAGRAAGTFHPARPRVVSGRVRLAQAAACLDEARRLDVARAFVRAALTSRRVMLRRFAQDVPEHADALRTAQDALYALHEAIDRAPSLDALRGVEGHATALAYALWPWLLGPRGHALGGFRARQRRPPPDPVNALVSFASMLTYGAAEAALTQTALDPTIGFLHEPGDRRPSLALDLAEPFKPLLVDRLVLTLVRRAEIRPEHFTTHTGNEGGVRLTDDGRRRVIQAWDQRLRRVFDDRALGRRISVQARMQRDAEALVRHVDDGTPFRPFQLVW